MKISSDTIIGGILGLVILCAIEYAGWVFMHSDGYYCYRGCSSMAFRGFCLLLVVNGGLLAVLANWIIPMTPYGKEKAAKEAAKQDEQLAMYRRYQERQKPNRRKRYK